MLTPEQIRANLQSVQRRINAACDRASRRPEEIVLVAVTKTFPAEAIDAAIAAGVTNIGENRVQEFRDKKPHVKGRATWHLIGHLQSNKAKDAVRLFDVIQTVDSLSLAEKIARAASAEGKRQDVLIEVNIGSEAQKVGVDPSDVAALSREIQKLEPLTLLGLMTIPPIGEPEQMRPFFQQMCRLQEETGLRHLSMGMTDDFEIAIEEGATIVRIGRAIFGSRG